MVAFDRRKMHCINGIVETKEQHEQRMETVRAKIRSGSKPNLSATMFIAMAAGLSIGTGGFLPRRFK